MATEASPWHRWVVANSRSVYNFPVKVFLHAYESPNAAMPDNSDRNFARIPVVGEYLTLANDSPLYQVLLVIHIPEYSNQDAEVWAMKIDESVSDIWRKVLERNA
jgi:hypothetical protein